MQPLMFACSSCGKRVGVPAEFAGRKVRCPHCKAVVTAPSATGAAVPTAAAPPNPSPPPPPPPTPPAPAPAPSAFTFSAPQQEGADSIFGEAEDAENSLFEAPKPKLRPPPAPTPSEPVAPPPTPPAVAPEDVTVPVAGDDNPFADMADALPATPVPPPIELPDAAEVARERPAVRKPAAAKRSAPWQLVVIVLLAGYSFAVTLLAAWGWLRTPAAAPDPAPAKAQKK